MKNLTISTKTLETLIESLDDAINVCYNVESRSENAERSYPYATGYSRSAMIHIREELKNLTD